MNNVKLDSSTASGGTRPVALGLGCFVALVFLGLMSRLPFPDYDLAFAQQLPLTLSGDLGAVAALILIACFTRRPELGPGKMGFTAAAVLAGWAFSLLVKGGVLGGSNALTLVIGDALAGFFTVLVALLWWLALVALPRESAVRALATACALASLLFCSANALPADFGRVLIPLVLIVVMGLCLMPIVSDEGKTPAPPNAPEKGAPERVGWLVPPSVAVVLVLAFFVVDFELDLFPISLYFEDMAYGSLPTPAFTCALLVLAFSGILYLLARRGPVPLGLLYTVGFLLTALGYLLTPYRLQGGFPLAAAEAGRIIVFIFALIVALRLQAASNTPAQSRALFAQSGLLMFAAMLAADVIVVLMQMQEGFDYGDFTFRTLFASCGIAVLVVLLIGPLPRVRELLAPSAPASPTDAAAPAAPTLDDRCDRFAERYGLTARETDILRLIAAGRDVPYIEHELILAKSTVKTHVKHIYEKCGISSRQALLDLLEEY